MEVDPQLSITYVSVSCAGACQLARAMELVTQGLRCERCMNARTRNEDDAQS